MGRLLRCRVRPCGGNQGPAGQDLGRAQGQGWDSPAGPGPWEDILGWTEYGRVRAGHPRGPGPGAGRGEHGAARVPAWASGPGQAVAPPPEPSPSPHPLPGPSLFLSPRVLEWVAQCPLPPKFS